MNDTENRAADEMPEPPAACGDVQTVLIVRSRPDVLGDIALFAAGVVWGALLALRLTLAD